MRHASRRSIALLSFVVVGSLTAFAAGAEVGAALDNHVAGMTLAKMPVPRLSLGSHAAKR